MDTFQHLEMVRVREREIESDNGQRMRVEIVYCY
jgi:hypothetical protein